MFLPYGSQGDIGALLSKVDLVLIIRSPKLLAILRALKIDTDIVHFSMVAETADTHVSLITTDSILTLYVVHLKVPKALLAVDFPNTIGIENKSLKI